jgi:hypothetical protein
LKQKPSKTPAATSLLSHGSYDFPLIRASLSCEIIIIHLHNHQSRSVFNNRGQKREDSAAALQEGEISKPLILEINAWLR